MNESATKLFTTCASLAAIGVKLLFPFLLHRKQAVCTKSDTGGQVINDAHSALEFVELQARKSTWPRVSKSRKSQEWRQKCVRYYFLPRSKSARNSVKHEKLSSDKPPDKLPSEAREWDTVDRV